jgi:hypothetical protein
MLRCPMIIGFYEIAALTCISRNAGALGVASLTRALDYPAVQHASLVGGRLP